MSSNRNKHSSTRTCEERFDLAMSCEFVTEEIPSNTSETVELKNAHAELQLNCMLQPQETELEDDDSLDAQAPFKSAIGRYLKLALLVSGVMVILSCALAALCFNKTLLALNAGYKHTFFEGLYFQWPVVFLILSWLSVYAMLVIGSVAICKRSYGEDHLIMQEDVFKRMIPLISGIILFLIPALTRFTMGLNEYQLEIGCIVGYAAPYYNLYGACEATGLLSVISLAVLQHFRLSSRRFYHVCCIFIMSICLLTSYAMMRLNLRLQSWMSLPYAFAYLFVMYAPVIILKRMHAAALRSI